MTQYQTRNKETKHNKNLCERAIDLSILQDLFPSVSKPEKKNLRKDKQGMHIAAWSCCSQRLFDGIHCCTTFVFDYMSQFNDGKN